MHESGWSREWRTGAQDGTRLLGCHRHGRCIGIVEKSAQVETATPLVVARQLEAPDPVPVGSPLGDLDDSEKTHAHES